MVNPDIFLEDMACGHVGMISHLAFSPTGNGLASTSLDSTLRIWRLDQLTTPKVAKGHSYNVTAVAWAPQGQLLATASDDRRVIFWSFPSLAETGSLASHPKGITRLAWSPNGVHLVTCSNDRRIRIFEVGSKQIQSRLEGHVSLPRCVAYDQRGSFLASGSEGGTVRLWKGVGYAPDKVLYGHRGGVNHLAWHPDGRLASASEDGNIRIWNVVKGTCEQELSGHDGPVKALAFSGCGRLMASKSWDLTLRIWRTDSWTPVAIIEEDTTAPFPNLAFHPKEGRLASVGGVDRAVRLWRLDIGRLASGATAGKVLNFRETEVTILHNKGFEDLASAPSKRKKARKTATQAPSAPVATAPLEKPLFRSSPPPKAPSGPILPEIKCIECGEAITGGQIQRRQGLGFSYINCPVCEQRVELSAGGPATLSDWAGARKLILAVMFTDIVDSTAIARRLGNQGMKAVRHQHFERVRTAIRAHRGYEVKTIGDSFMAAFKTVGDGLDCALDVLRNTGHAEINIRGSLHVGPVDVEENDLFGSMVNFCARLMGQAEGTNLCVSEEARSHVMQEGEERHTTLDWQAVDDVAFKGFHGKWRVWRLQ